MNKSLPHSFSKIKNCQRIGSCLRLDSMEMNNSMNNATRMQVVHLQKFILKITNSTVEHKKILGNIIKKDQLIKIEWKVARGR